MTAATINTTNTGNSIFDGNAHDLAQQVNDAFADRGERTVCVNGRKVRAHFPGCQPAEVYANGTIGVTVEGRTKGKVGTVYTKVGETLSLCVED